jgi:formylglycine-generating enzyme required for sulfatase activity
MKDSAILSLGMLLVALTCAAQTVPTKPTVALLSQNTQLKSPVVAQEGETLTLAATCTGSTPLTFQWFLNGDPISDATNASYAVPVSQRADGDYSVVAANAAGQAASDPFRLLLSNVKPAQYMGLEVKSITTNALLIQYTDSLSSNSAWAPLVGLTSSVWPLVIVDPAPIIGSQRFYETRRESGVTGRLLPGWQYLDPAGSVHAIEYIEPQGGDTNWRPLQTFTLPTSPNLFVDPTATNGLPRRYRTTLLESAASRRTGQLVYTVKWTLPADVYTSLVSTNRAVLQGLGMTLNDNDSALESPTNALPGYWVAVGDQRAMSDSNGVFQIDLPYGITNGFVIQRRGDRTIPALAIFGVSQLVPPGQTGPPIVVRFERFGVLNMNGTYQSKGSGPDCTDPCASCGNTKACCLDYNGLISDGCRYPDSWDSLVAKLLRYFNSTCYRNVNAGLCAAEFNALRFIEVPVPPYVVPYAPMVGPTCFQNHKYRNCQNCVKTDLTLAASALVVNCGETIQLTVHNNTWGNETELLLGPSKVKNPGDLKGRSLVAAPAPGTFVLRHYDDWATPKPVHLEDQIVQYTAPTLQELDSAEGWDYQAVVTARSGGEVRTLTIQVMQGCNCPLSSYLVPELVDIPAGSFRMGSPESELVRYSDEPQHTVTISHAFKMGKYEVTQAEYQSVMGVNPSYFPGDLTRPVETVSWLNASNYCCRLTACEARAGRLPGGWVYRLPTEAEWEYACRAGTATPFHYGNELRSGMANFDGRYEYLVGDPYHYNSSGIYLGTTAVGSYGANAWGLYDMHGNVWEWCLDWGGTYAGSVTDPTGPSTGSDRVVRGGGWGYGADYCRSAYRSGIYPGDRDGRLGFRVALVPVH